MKQFFSQYSNRWDSPQSGMQSLFALMGVNILVFILLNLDRNGQLADFMILRVGAFRNGAFWQLLTACFSHESVWHLFFNLFSLYVFGSLAAPIMGMRKFLTLYVFSGVFGNILFLMSSWDQGGSGVLGASGAVMGVILVAAMMRPNVQMLLLFFPRPISLRTLAIVFLAFDLINQLGNAGSQVAYIAHLGGALGAYLVIWFLSERQIEWNPLAFGRKRPNSYERHTPPGWNMAPPPSGKDASDSSSNSRVPSGTVTQKELDYLLDKISRGGINSLTEAELARLRQAREQMRGQ